MGVGKAKRVILNWTELENWSPLKNCNRGTATFTIWVTARLHICLTFYRQHKLTIHFSLVCSTKMDSTTFIFVFSNIITAQHTSALCIKHQKYCCYSLFKGTGLKAVGSLPHRFKHCGNQIVLTLFVQDQTLYARPISL